MDFNYYLIQSILGTGEIVYDIGHVPNTVYLLRAGVVAMYAVVELQEVNKFPTGPNTWEQHTTTRKIQYELRHLKVNEFFGHQEVIESISKEDRE